jgi:hypothetical protein
MSLPGKARSGWDAQPEGPCAILLAGDGRRPFSAQAVAEAVSRAAGNLIAVVTVAKIHGSAFGLPNPGLMPTRREIDERQEWVSEAMKTITALGGKADGQVAVTRKATSTLARIARTRSAGTIVIDETPYRGLRRFIEGDVGAELSRRCRRARIAVAIIPYLSGSPADL